MARRDSKDLEGEVQAELRRGASAVLQTAGGALVLEAGTKPRLQD